MNKSHAVQQTVKTLLREARTAHYQQDLSKANAKLDDALKLSQEPTLLAAIASVLWELGRLDDMVATLKLALKKLDSSPQELTAEKSQLLTRLGAAQLRLGHIQAALSVLYNALKISDSGGYSALHLGNTLRYLGEWEEAKGHLSRAYNKAKAERDGALAISNLCAQGELALDMGEGQKAVELFGKAFGLTEFSSDEALSILPLAGLAHAHVLWGYPQKGQDVATKALERARAARDQAGSARALLSLGLAKQSVDILKQAEHSAKLAPHQPLRLRTLIARLKLAPDVEVQKKAVQLAKELGIAVNLSWKVKSR